MARRVPSAGTWPADGSIRGEFFNAVPKANISIVNTKSDFKPVYIYEPGTLIIPYGGGAVETRPDWAAIRVKRIFHLRECMGSSLEKRFGRASGRTVAYGL